MHVHTYTPILLSKVIHSVVVNGRDVLSSNDGSLNSLKLPSDIVAVPDNGRFTLVSILAATSSNTWSPLIHEAYRPQRQYYWENNNKCTVESLLSLKE